MLVSLSVALIQVNAIGRVTYIGLPLKSECEQFVGKMAPLTVYLSRLIGLFTLIVAGSMLAENPARWRW